MIMNLSIAFVKGLEPPEPECAFPDKDFGTYGSLQGDMELVERILETILG
jgi:hypothetical protein